MRSVRKMTNEMSDILFLKRGLWNPACVSQAAAPLLLSWATFQGLVAPCGVWVTQWTVKVQLFCVTWMATKWWWAFPASSNFSLKTFWACSLASLHFVPVFLPAWHFLHVGSFTSTLVESSYQPHKVDAITTPIVQVRNLGLETTGLLTVRTWYVTCDMWAAAVCCGLLRSAEGNTVEWAVMPPFGKGMGSQMKEWVSS